MTGRAIQRRRLKEWARPRMVSRNLRCRRGSFLLLQQIPNRLRNRVDVRDNGFFQSWAERDRHVGAVEATDWGVEVVEAALHDLGGDLGADSARAVGLVGDEQP